MIPKADLLAETSGDYIGAQNQHADIINQAMREQAILRDISAEFNKMLERDKAWTLERIALHADITPEREFLGWLLDQYGVHRELQGKHDYKAGYFDGLVTCGGVTREQHYVTVIRSSFAYQLHRELADLIYDAIEEVALGGVS